MIRVRRNHPDTSPILWLSALCVVLLFSSPLSADELKYLSWNIANLASAGVEHRGYKRDDSDIKHIRLMINEADADIITLQEISSVEVAHQILGNDYFLQFEARCHAIQSETDTPDPCVKTDIYTVIAYHKRIKHRIKKRFHFSDLAIPHVSECPGPSRLVRGAPGLILSNKAKPDTHIISVHLKAGCKTNRHENAKNYPDLVDDCATGEKQFDILLNWVSTRPDEQIIIAGDFNRRLAPGDSRYRMLTALNRTFALYPKSHDEQCFTKDFINRMGKSYTKFDKQKHGVKDDAWINVYTPNFNKGIDHFLVFDAEGSARQPFKARIMPFESEARFKPPTDAFLRTCDGTPNYDEGDKQDTLLVFAEAYPSDHCLITLTPK